jgi:hypothetical protein
LNYFSQNKQSIQFFVDQQKKIMGDLVNSGLIKDTEWIVHNNALPNTVRKLYGINKWANENKMDIVLHIHFNDYPRRWRSQRGDYSGFAIYVPERQYSNAKASYALAESVFDQLEGFLAVSDLPKEKIGIIEDQKLIAIGSNNTLDSTALLIEYGYIYESKFTNSEIRLLIFKELAERTISGIQGFLDQKGDYLSNKESVAYKWLRDLNKGVKNNRDVFTLQMALFSEGLYPPREKNNENCPVNGNFGNCTAASVKEFQNRYSIPITGFVDSLTRTWLNTIFSH